MDRRYWLGRRVLITGHTGFKGAWLALWLHELGARVTGLALPATHDRGMFASAGPWDELDSRTVDLTDSDETSSMVAATDPQVVFHLAAQVLVRRSYVDPIGTFATNVLGTVNVLNALRGASSLDAAVFVTSDKVYANAGDGRPFTEDDLLGGDDPYSASKACAELAVRSWRASFMAGARCKVATARAGNVIGGGDWSDDRIVPDVMRALFARTPVVLRYPRATRPWQHVLEPLAGYLALAEYLSDAPPSHVAALNFGPDSQSSATVADVVDRLIAQWGGGEWRQDTTPQPAEAALLSLDTSLAQDTLGWRPLLSLDESLAWTADWYRAQHDGLDMRAVSLAQIEAYESRLAG